MEKTPMTVAGAEQLRKDLDFLKTVERPRISNAIAEAREHGDLSENAEYAAAREEQGICEAKIKNMETQLATAEIIDVTRMKKVPDSERKVVFGATVKLERDDTQGIDVTPDIGLRSFQDFRSSVIDRAGRSLKDGMCIRHRFWRWNDENDSIGKWLHDGQRP